MLPLRLSYSPGRLICFLVGFFVLRAHAKDAVLTVPEQVSLSPNMYTQQLSISWVGTGASAFDIMILRTELNETVFHETVSSSADSVTGRHMWNWTSLEPLECTSLSVRICSRDGARTSEWSNTQILRGMDLPSNDRFQMFPQDRIVPVGINTTFCCIVEEGKEFGSLRYGNMVMNTSRLSRRSYASTAFLQRASARTGTNVVCNDKLKSKITGAVIFVGYPPQPSDLVCETRDLISVVCQWNVGRDTHLYGRRRTNYTLNKRLCNSSSHQAKLRICTLDNWEGNWTLEAVNPLGKSVLTDSAEISSRINPVAPISLTSINKSWNATVLWGWEHSTYLTLALVCQVQLNKSMQTFSGVGLQSAFLPNLYPDKTYVVQVRCGAQKNFWKWGNWSQPYSFKTQPDAPVAPDAWQYVNTDGSGTIMWKPTSDQDSRGQITGYDVTLWSPEQQSQYLEIPPTKTSVRVSLTEFNCSKVIANVVAKNIAGESPPARVVIPLQVADRKLMTVSKAVYMDGGFPLLWLNDTNSSCGYVVEWYDSLCQLDCPLEWMKVTTGTTNVSLVSANFQPGVKYNIALYSCSSEMLQRWQGYSQELAPSSPVPQLVTTQQDSDIILTWGQIPVVNRRGYLLGYNVYISDGPQLELLANIPNADIRKYTVKGLSLGSYKFTVKAYTAAGEDSGATSSISPTSYTDWLILEILASLGTTALFLAVITLICYKKRKWVKKTFYPDIPEPKLPGDWSSTQGPLDVKPSPHSLVHVVHKPEWDSSKEVLVVIPEEDEEDEVPDDTDEATSLRYYNQVVDERPIRPRYPDSSESSASSLDSASTDVTYTGIQTTGSSLVFPLDPQDSTEGLRTQGDLPVGGGDADGGYRPQMHPQLQSEDFSQAPDASAMELEADGPSGYKPQVNWSLDSPGEAAENRDAAPCLGSPTSVASTQFLLHDGESEEHADEKRHQTSSAASWFTNLISSTKP
ncbi:LIF receptor subunit alpha a isoform X2 [Synchiropus splendidus]|uniref:LIF receptor subunit alpha a isoform X2 n=1 Tax=Synchiropus splendidus TaxID=270530 RepID=UPI00237ECE87|nr:LIF receptor subunit alpha a isoform X2 [Synchiropus splendidus]